MQVDSEGAAGGSNIGAGTANSSGGIAAGGTAAKPSTADVSMGEDDELARALMMSMEDHTEKPSASAQVRLEVLSCVETMRVGKHSQCLWLFQEHPHREAQCRGTGATA